MLHENLLMTMINMFFSVGIRHFPAGFDLQRQTVVRCHNLAVEPDEMEPHEV